MKNTKRTNPLAKMWQFLDGKKLWIGLTGLIVEGGTFLLDNPPLLLALPDKVQGALTGILSTLVALGVLHRAEKQEIGTEK